MTDKELRRMSRADLIEIIYQYKQKNEELSSENRRLSEELEDRIIRLESAGSIADAALSLNKIFEAAQQAADDYLDSLKFKNADDFPDIDTEKKAIDILSDAKARAEEVIKDSDRYYDEMKKKADREYAEKLKQAQEECEEMKRLLVKVVSANASKESEDNA